MANRATATSNRVIRISISPDVMKFIRLMRLQGCAATSGNSAPTTGRDHITSRPRVPVRTFAGGRLACPGGQLERGAVEPRQISRAGSTQRDSALRELSSKLKCHCCDLPQVLVNAVKRLVSGTALEVPPEPASVRGERGGSTVSSSESWTRRQRRSRGVGRAEWLDVALLGGRRDGSPGLLSRIHTPN